MGTSLIIFCHNKLSLLWHCLPTILAQEVDDLEILVVSDTPEQDDLKTYCASAGVKVLFTGNTKPRTWCVAANIGVRATSGDNIILCHAEIYHLDKEVLYQLIQGVSPGVVTHPRGRDDQSGKYLSNVAGGHPHDPQLFRRMPLLNTKVSFIQCMTRADFELIGGFDEEFADGHAFEDVDFVERLELSGCKFVEVPAQVVHLYHLRGQVARSKWERNRKLLHAKRLKRC